MMSSLIHLYLVDEDVYPNTLTGDDEAKYQALLSITEDEAIRWQSLELNMRGFIPALATWDKIAGNSKLLSVCSFHYYPNQLIGPTADLSGSFGFFPAKMVQDLFSVMQKYYDFNLDSPKGHDIIEAIEAEMGEVDFQAYEMVRDRYFVSFRDAAEQGKAIVVLIED
ncbi:hypothetical protein G3469_12065 [Shewanella baltica]|nr:hypothetical protein [Shewanella baltica]